MAPPSDPVRNGLTKTQDVTTLVCDERGECFSSTDAVSAEFSSLSSSSFVSEPSNYSESSTEACYSQPVSLSRAPTSIWHSYVVSNSREQTAARALGRALSSWIEDIEARNKTLDPRDQVVIDPRLRGLASVLKQGFLPTAHDIESN